MQRLARVSCCAAAVAAAIASTARAEPADAAPLATALEEFGLALGGQVRLRGEVDARDFAPSTQADVVTGERVRLSLTARPLAGVSAFVQMQDARVWGEEQSTLDAAQVDRLDLHQGHLELTELLGAPLALRAGRQEVAFGEERLIGAVDWTMNARSLEGVLVTYRYGDSGRIQPFWFLLSERDAIAAKGALKQADPKVDEGKDDDTWIAGLQAHQQLGDAGTLQPHFYVLDDGTGDVQLYTLGAYGSLAHWPLLDDLDLVGNATFDVQLGDVQGDPIRAYLAVVHGGVRSGIVTLTVGFERLSGDPDSGDGNREAFDTLLATNHKFYGEMDYFLNNAADTAGLGLEDLVAKLRVKLADRTTLAMDAHGFRAAERDATAGTEPSERRLGGERRFGEELDVWVVHAFDPHLELRAGYSAFLPGAAMKARFAAQDAARGAPPRSQGGTGHWGYLQAGFTF